MTSIDELVSEAERKLKTLKSIRKNFPDAKLSHLAHNRPVIVARSANSLVDSYEASDLLVGFYFHWDDTKIYADPIIQTMDYQYHENDWLEDAIKAKIRPQILVELMRKRRSHYLSVKYYFDKYPVLRKWLATY